MTGAITVLGVLVLVVLAVIDLRWRVVPNAIVLPAAAAILVAQCLATPDRALEWTVASLGTAALLLVVHLAFPPGLGMGDVKLGLLLGALLGAHTPTALVLAGLAAALAGAFVLLARGAAARRTALPFAPFVALGALLALLA